MALNTVLIIVGLVVAFIAFALGGINMLRGVHGDFDSVFKRHIGVMVVMALGGLLFVIGLALTGVDFLGRLAF